ncbi:unnamed protein product, partial [Rhizophagus irregularis]
MVLKEFLSNFSIRYFLWFCTYFFECSGVVLLAAVGALTITIKALSFWRLIFDLYIRLAKAEEVGAGTGAWAVITGASDGIGKEFAYQLAAAKFNVFLISRTESKLQDISNDIESKYQVKSRIYAMDFTKGDKRDYENLKEIIEELVDVG